MGVGFPLDLVVCTALGVDMFDCVYPTRTARFGTALVPSGELNLRHAKFTTDFRRLDESCDCLCCRRGYSRAFLNSFAGQPESVGSSLLSLHNIAYQLRLMRSMREAIASGRFPDFVRSFLAAQFPGGPKDYPEWAVEALASVGIEFDNQVKK